MLNRKTTDKRHDGRQTTNRWAAVVTAAMTCVVTALAQPVSQQDMQRIYQEVRTPYKYGLVVAPTDNGHKIDCPTVFRVGEKWLMTYVVYNGKEGLDGRGYETWLAESDDLLHWHTGAPAFL